MNKYRYINIGGKYYCQQQSILRLAGLLLFNRKICPDFVSWTLLSHLWTGRGRSVKGNEIANAVRDMAERYEGTDTELALSLSEKPDLYRLLYYIERIFAMLSKFELQPQFLLPWVNIYREFEADRA